MAKHTKSTSSKEVGEGTVGYLQEPQVTLQGRYNELAVIRQPFLDRARDASRLTIPSLIPPEGTNGSSKLYKPTKNGIDSAG